MGIMVEVSGRYASFNRPEFKVERMTYEVMTPSAARGILDSIYWHPGLSWHIDKIYVLNPIKFTSFLRNEVKSKVSPRQVTAVINGKKSSLCIDRNSDIQQRSAVVLKDVRYIIEAHFEITSKANETDSSGKFQSIIKRRLKNGQCYNQPYLGCREFPAKFKEWKGSSDDIQTAYPHSTKELGLMLYDMDYHDTDCTNNKEITPMYFRAILKNGVLDVEDCEVFC